MARGKFRLRSLGLALAALVVVQAGVSLSLRLPSVHRALRSRLEQSIGRQVEVGHFDLRLWTGLRLEAHYITVEQDPEFGSEFLLRADRLDASLDPRSLLRGALVFSRLGMERPSLNVVRTSSGRWNLELWEARGTRGQTQNPAPARMASISNVAIHDGRVNFKRGPEKLPFALLDVNGNLSASSAGRWNLSLRARPFRAGVILQEAGDFLLQGGLPAAGGLATPEAPLELSAQWEKASISDALRLIFGRDFGARGRLESSITLRRAPAIAPDSSGSGEIQPFTPAWTFSGALRLADVHRWDLPLEPGLPGLNLSFRGVGSADRHRWEGTDILLEGPRSNLRARARFNRDAIPQASLRLVTSGIHLDDLLVWYRAFHPGVARAATLEGYLGADVELEAWPLAMVRAAVVTTGARLLLPGRPSTVVLRRTVLEGNRTGVRLGETSIAFGGSEPGMRLSGQLGWTSGFPFTLRAAGATDHLGDFSAAVAALGLAPAARPLQALGTVGLRLSASGFARPWRHETQGNATFENLTLSGGTLRSDLSIGKARLDFLPGLRRLQITSAKAFGAHWSGTLTARALAGPWAFQLAADRVTPALLVAGFSSAPPGDSSLLSRILPAQAAATVAREEPRWPEWLRGEGNISAGTLAVGRLQFQRFHGRLSIAERSMDLDAAEALLAGGRVRGAARAIFGEEPSYSVRTDFDSINVATIAALAVTAGECCSGTGSGHIELSASGWNREALLASLIGKGTASVRSGALLTLDLPAAFAGRTAVPGRTSLRDVSGEFSFAKGHASLDHLVLDFPSSAAEATGSVDYHGQLELRLSVIPLETDGPRVEPPHLLLKGTLAAPEVTPARAPGF